MPFGITYQTLDGRTAEREALSWDAVLMQHEVDHLDGILYPMRMKDLSTLSFNSSPGLLAEGCRPHGRPRPAAEEARRELAHAGEMGGIPRTLSDGSQFRLRTLVGLVVGMVMHE
jgi:hypothetical protein